MSDEEVVKDALKDIFTGINKLKAAFPPKGFPIDGRLVGDIGEAIIQRDYDVRLFGSPIGGHDGKTSDGRLVQIKATFKDSLTFRVIPDYYLGIRIHEDGSYTEIYNGPADSIREKYGHRKGFGEKLLPFPNIGLLGLSKEIAEDRRIPKRNKQEQEIPKTRETQEIRETQETRETQELPETPKVPETRETQKMQEQKAVQQKLLTGAELWQDSDS